MTAPGKIPFHPLANCFPLMEGEEFDALVADIREHGLRESIVLFEGEILDGRNRYRACIEAGVEPTCAAPFSGNHADAIDFVISANIHRRHLTPGQKRELIARRLKANPEMSDRSIAKIAKVSHHTVAKARKATGQSAQLEKRIGADGKARSQPATKPMPLPASTVEAIKADVKARVLKVLGLSDATLARIDAWSARQDDTPDRAAAICRLVEIALNATEPRGTSKPAVERALPPELAPIPDDYPEMPPGLVRAPKPTTH
jgi:hypothetical protein